MTYALMPSDEDKVADRCQTAIINKLRSPSTAEYGDDVKVTSEKGNFGTYCEVFGTVAAQNGFGGPCAARTTAR
ncbi:hypothetical protein ACIBBG_32210 [Micromonospora chersina]|uniref:hypothetical protein n=1 Tax=Micromonospora chersina TaxID=47854 RepID=UPI0037AB6B7E